MLRQPSGRIVLNGVAHDFDQSWWEPAVERAAQALYEREREYRAGFPKWEDQPHQQAWRDDAATVLTAALEEK